MSVSGTASRAMTDERELELRASDREDKWRLWLGGRILNIEAHAAKTNSRVAKLEMWRAAAMGGLAVITAIVIPMALGLLLE